MTEPQHVKALVEAPEPVVIEALAPVHFGKFTFTTTGVVVDGKPSFDEWAEAVAALSVLERGLAFIVGDMLAYGEAVYGEAAAQAIDARSWRPETVRAYCWLSKQVPKDNRMLDRGLTVAHHLAVAALAPRDQRTWLRRALNDGEPHWSVSRLKAAIKTGADADATKWYVLVECRSERDQAHVMKQLELDGRPCKAVTKRGEG